MNRGFPSDPGMGLDVTVALERQLQVAVRHDSEMARDSGDFKKVWTMSRLFPLLHLPHEGVTRYCHAVRLALRDELTRRSLTLDTQPKGVRWGGGCVVSAVYLTSGRFGIACP